MLPVFERATASVLARLGENAVLRGTVNCKVNVERDVELIGFDGAMSANAYMHSNDSAVRIAQAVATIAVTHDPRVRDSLAIGSDTYRLDSLIADNGYSRRFVLLKI